MCADHQRIYCAFRVINADWILNNYNYLYMTLNATLLNWNKSNKSMVHSIRAHPSLIRDGMFRTASGLRRRGFRFCAVWELQCARFTPTTCCPIPAVSPGASGARSPPCGRYVCLSPCVSRGKTERWWTVRVTTVNDDGSGRPRAGPRAAGHSRTNSHIYIIFMTLTRAFRALYDAFLKL